MAFKFLQLSENNRKIYFYCYIINNRFKKNNIIYCILFSIRENPILSEALNFTFLIE